MRRALWIAVACWASSASAADPKDDAQQKVDAAMQQSCALAKKNVADQAAACPDEHQALGALDCADKAARKAVDYLKLNVACAKRIKEGAKKTK